jgi:hypothetical protein
MRFKLTPRARRLAIVSTLVTASLFAFSCAHGQAVRHGGTIASTAIYTALNDASSAADTLCANHNPVGQPIACDPAPGHITTAQRIQLAKNLLPAIAAGRDFNATVKAYDPSKPMPSQLVTIATSISKAFTDIVNNWPDDKTKAVMLNALGGVPGAILKFLGLIPTGTSPSPAALIDQMTQAVTPTR